MIPYTTQKKQNQRREVKGFMINYPSLVLGKFGGRKKYGKDDIF